MLVLFIRTNTHFWALAILCSCSFLYINRTFSHSFHSLHSQCFLFFGTIFNFAKQTSAFSFQKYKFDRKRVKCKSSKGAPVCLSLWFRYFCVYFGEFLFFSRFVVSVSVCRIFSSSFHSQPLSAVKYVQVYG